MPTWPRATHAVASDLRSPGRVRPRAALLAGALLLAPSTALRAQDAADLPGPHAPPIADYPAAPLEDSRGRLWFATAFQGVVRHDGQRFENLTTADGLASDTVRDILEDSREEGVLWFGTGGGLTRLDGGTFTTIDTYTGEGLVDAPPFGEHPHHREVWDVYQGRGGDLWIATMDGAYRLVDDERLVRFPIPALDAEHAHDFTSRMVYRVFEDGRGHRWFATDGAGAARWDGSQWTVLTTADGLGSDRVCSVLEDAAGRLWFGTVKGGVSRYDGERVETFLRDPLREATDGWYAYMGSVADDSGQLWFGVSGAGGGIQRYDGVSFRRHGTEHGLGEGGVIDLALDRSGRLWAGTTSGVYRRDGERFVHVPRVDAASGSPPPR